MSINIPVSFWSQAASIAWERVLSRACSLPLTKCSHIAAPFWADFRYCSALLTHANYRERWVYTSLKRGQNWTNPVSWRTSRTPVELGLKKETGQYDEESCYLISCSSFHWLSRTTVCYCTPLMNCWVKRWGENWFCSELMLVQILNLVPLFVVVLSCFLLQPYSIFSLESIQPVKSFGSVS